jgi:hypothetical protein
MLAALTPGLFIGKHNPSWKSSDKATLAIEIQQDDNRISGGLGK